MGGAKIFAMLKITLEKNPDSVRIVLEGKLTGPWISELEHEWRTIQLSQPPSQPSGTVSLLVDLTGVTFVGEEGKALLKRMWREGARLIATGCCTGHIVEEITHSQPDVSSVG
jgi:hypothetical protein